MVTAHGLSYMSKLTHVHFARDLMWYGCSETISFVQLEAAASIFLRTYTLHSVNKSSEKCYFGTKFGVSTDLN